MDSDILLQLRKSKMKKVEKVLNFKKDTLFILGRKFKLNTTSSGTYYVLSPNHYSYRVKDVQSNFVKEIDKNTHEKKTIDCQGIILAVQYFWQEQTEHFGKNVLI